MSVKREYQKYIYYDDGSILSVIRLNNISDHFYAYIGFEKYVNHVTNKNGLFSLW